jgi:hypothetical protein
MESEGGVLRRIFRLKRDGVIEEYRRIEEIAQ